MKPLNIKQSSVEQLVNRFAEIGVAQDKALLEDGISEFNRLYDQKIAIVNELSSRRGDQRRALLRLYTHPNMQVRLNAANATLAVSPKEARDILKRIADSNVFPQAGDAGMALVNLERGIYKPT